MRLIHIMIFLEREQIMENGERVNHLTYKVFDFRDDEATE